MMCVGTHWTANNTMAIESQKPLMITETGPASAPVLFVDLDRTLIATDMLFESLLLLAKESPTSLLRVPGWLMQGKAALKRHLADRVMPDVTHLPYRPQVLDFLKQQKDAGRRIILITASDQRIADAVATHLGLFDEAIGSDASRNLKGARKLEHIESLCTERGWPKFGYLGDTWADLPIWRRCEEVYVANATPKLTRRLAADAKKHTVVHQRTPIFAAIVKVMRPHQWAKNVLVFLPVVLSHKWTPENLLLSLLAFAAFSVVASSVYITNDLLDIESDRRHHSKHRRPFAAGRLPVELGPPLAAILLIAGFAASLIALPHRFTATLAGYLVITLLYSFWLKRKLLVDVILLAGLYTLRLLAGGFAVSVTVTDWLLAFSMFIFVSLAFVKRYTELARQAELETAHNSSRGYMHSDLQLIKSIGVTSGFAAVVIFALYLKSDEVKHLLSPDQPLNANPTALWLICPLLIYWNSRMWFMADRGFVHDDPLVFAAKDKISWAVAAMIAVLVLLAISWHKLGLP